MQVVPFSAQQWNPSTHTGHSTAAHKMHWRGPVIHALKHHIQHPATHHQFILQQYSLQLENNPQSLSEVHSCVQLLVAVYTPLVVMETVLMVGVAFWLSMFLSTSMRNALTFTPCTGFENSYKAITCFLSFSGIPMASMVIFSPLYSMVCLAILTCE